MHIRLLIILISLTFFTKEAWSQCLEISSVFVNACTEGTGTTNCTQEGPNEMFTFTVGSSDLFVGDISVNWPNNAFQGFCNSAVTALKTDTLNNTITSSCGILLEPLTDTLPAGSKVIVITSTDFCASANSFSGLADTMYILYQCAGNTAGHFANSPSGTRTLEVTVTGPCTQVESVTYDGAIPNTDGATAFFDAAGNVSYAVLGCNAPVVSLSADWSFTNEICNDYGLVNLDLLLSGNATLGGTWSGPRVTGNTYDPSGYLGLDSISYSVTGTGACTDTLDSTIVFNVTQVNTGLATLQSCDSVFVSGTWYSSSTTFTETIPGIGFSCDSLVNYTIIIENAIVDSSYLSGCGSVNYAGNTYTADTILRDTIFGSSGPVVIDTILSTGFEDAEGWVDHSSGNWTQVDANGTWTAVDMYANQFNPNNGIRNVGMNTVGDYLEFPPVNNPQTLYYYDRLSSAPTSFNELSIQYFDGSVWQTLATDSCGHTDYRLVTIDVSALSGQSNVIFRIFRSQDNRSAYIDDIVIVGSTTGGGSNCDSIAITNIDILNPATGTDTRTACNSYTWIDGNTYSTSNSSATFTIVGGAANGCDSLVTLNLTINTAVNSNNPGNPFVICDTNDSIQLPGGDFANTAGTFIDTLVGAASNGCDSIITTTVITQPCGFVCAYDFGPDTSLCQGESLLLDPGTGYDDYLWQDNSNAQTYLVNATGTYYCTTTFIDSSDNLVINGDFEQGNIGFTTDYGPGVGGAFGLLTNAGTYAINTSPSNVHNNFFSCVDHTSGTGNLMIVNGSNVPNTDVWCQTITVSPNTDYLFSAWVISLETTNSSNVATLNFKIDGVQFGTDFSPSLIGCDWQQFSATYNSGSNTSIEICIESDVISGNNDYGIDDIFFTPFCNYTDTINVTVNPFPTPDLGADIDICQGNDTLLDATTSNASYLWQDGTTNTSTFLAQNTGLYWVDVTVDGCTGRDSVNIFVNPIFTENQSLNICAGDSLFLENAWQNTSSTYVDTFSSTNNCDSIVITDLFVINPLLTADTLIVCANELPVNIFGNGENSPGVYTDTVASALGCDSLITSVALVVNPNPSISLGSDTTVNAGVNLTINVDNPNPNESYTWINDLGESFFGPSIIANTTSTAEYTLTVTNEFGCLNYDTIKVTVNPLEETLLLLPTAFSPNGDGINDIFRIANFEEFENYILRVYNRWGGLLYDNQGFNVGWDGSYLGVKQNIGVYSYYIEAQPINGASIMKTSGTVSLIR